MTTKAKPLSQTQRTLLIAAAARNDHLVPLPQLPVAAARQVIRSMLNAALVEEVPAPIGDASFAWRSGEDGSVLMLRVTALGLDQFGECEAAKALGITNEPAAKTDVDVADTISIGGEGSEAEEASTAGVSLANANRPPEGDRKGTVGVDHGESDRPSIYSAQAAAAIRTTVGRTARLGSLRQATQVLLDAWDGLAEGCRADVGEIAGPTAALRVALAASASADQRTDRTSLRPDTKQAQVLTMLRRHEGASGPQSAEAMGWAPHTVRGFLAGLAKKGIKVEVLERVRQVGQGKPGAKGSFSIYHVAGES
jgi:hypothetical protein